MAPPPKELPVRARRLLPAFLLVLIAASAYRMGVSSPEREASSVAVGDRLVLRGDTMGTTYSVTVAASSDPAATRSLVETELQAVDAAMSTYRADSELSALNRAAAGAPVEVSAPLREVLAVALEVGRRSGGALDIAVGPLVDAWGFGPPDAGSEPSDAALQALRPLYGEGAVTLGASGVTKRAAAVRIDLSSVAKGYAVDRVAAALKRAGHASYLIEVGGEVVAHGTRPGGGDWRIGVERPTAGGRDVLRAIVLREVGMATSGDYRNFRQLGDVRVSHIIDPRTAHPASSALASVTVLDPQVARADAWATALTVLGPDEGMKVARRENLRVLFVVRAGQGELRSMESEAFTRYVSETSP